MEKENMAIFPSIKGKIAVVTGAGSGIGRAVAILFAKNGADLFLMSRNEEKLKETQKMCKNYGVRCLYHSTDVTDPIAIKTSFAKCIKTFERIDILCNVAGGSLGRKLTSDMTGDEFDEVYKLNLKNVFLCCSETIPAMKNKQYGKL
ncbi:SDR family oxidoreductase [Virgibacillus sp. NKC19-3]|nr:SDR family oxidoreductase [Virgibacillus sp. NKC19-3]MBY7144458.1 SDR family oxidoreductase [Virgibacillus sp. NKC19-3]